MISKKFILPTILLIMISLAVLFSSVITRFRFVLMSFMIKLDLLPASSFRMFILMLPAKCPNCCNLCPDRLIK